MVYRWSSQKSMNIHRNRITPFISRKNLICDEYMFLTKIAVLSKSYKAARSLGNTKCYFRTRYLYITNLICCERLKMPIRPLRTVKSGHYSELWINNAIWKVDYFPGLFYHQNIRMRRCNFSVDILIPKAIPWPFLHVNMAANQLSFA